MLVKNLTSKKQTIKVREIVGDHNEYEFIVQPGSSTEIDYHFSIINPEKYAGIFDLGCKCAPVVEKVAPKKEEAPATVVEPVEKVEEVVEEKKDEPVSESEFVCDICGAEFASARGLASHKNKAHAE